MNSVGVSPSAAGISALITGGAAVFSIVFWIVYAVLFVICIIAAIKLFNKLGEPWWKAIIPFYSVWVLMSYLTPSNLLWFILLFVPFANIVALCYALFRIPIVFGKSAVMGVLDIFFAPIILLVLAFGSSEYQGF